MTYNAIPAKLLVWKVTFCIQSGEGTAKLDPHLRNKMHQNVAPRQGSKFHVEERSFIFLSSCGCSCWQHLSSWKESWPHSAQSLQLKFEPGLWLMSEECCNSLGLSGGSVKTGGAIFTQTLCLVGDAVTASTWGTVEPGATEQKNLL